MYHNFFEGPSTEVTVMLYSNTNLKATFSHSLTMDQTREEQPQNIILSVFVSFKTVCTNVQQIRMAINQKSPLL